MHTRWCRFCMDPKTLSPKNELHQGGILARPVKIVKTAKVERQPSLSPLLKRDRDVIPGGPIERNAFMAVSHHQASSDKALPGRRRKGSSAPADVMIQRCHVQAGISNRWLSNTIFKGSTKSSAKKCHLPTFWALRNGTSWILKLPLQETVPLRPSRGTLQHVCLSWPQMSQLS